MKTLEIRCRKLLSCVMMPCACLFLSACATVTRHPVAYHQYQKIPLSTSSKVYRAALRSNRWTRARSFYGNYGGPGNTGGRPIDTMDDLFRRHDIVYWESRAARTMKEADRALVSRLEDLDKLALPDGAHVYRRLVMEYFGSPAAKVLGKPVLSLFRRREAEGSVFGTAGSVREFFEADHPGFPDRDGADMLAVVQQGRGRSEGNPFPKNVRDDAAGDGRMQRAGTIADPGHGSWGNLQ